MVRKNKQVFSSDLFPEWGWIKIIPLLRIRASVFETLTFLVKGMHSLSWIKPNCQLLYSKTVVSISACKEIALVPISVLTWLIWVWVEPLTSVSGLLRYGLAAYKHVDRNKSQVNNACNIRQPEMGLFLVDWLAAMGGSCEVTKIKGSLCYLNRLKSCYGVITWCNLPIGFSVLLSWIQTSLS